MRTLKDKLRVSAMVFPVLLLAAPQAWAQTDTAGQAELALQGYCLGGSGQPLLQTSGMAVSLKEFIPGVGLLDSSMEAYGSNGFRTGTTFAGLEQVPLRGWHWDFMGGDFQLGANVVESPFLNIYTPEISGRGVRLAMKRKDRTYQIFVGEATLLGGPRIPFRITLPQMIVGSTLQQRIGDRWQVGVRYIHTSTDSGGLARYTNHFISRYGYQTSKSITLQSAYNITRDLRFYAEAGYGTASMFAGTHVAQTGTGAQQAVLEQSSGPMPSHLQEQPLSFLF